MPAEIIHIVCVDGLLCVIFVRKDSYLCLGVYKIIITQYFSYVGIFW